MQDRISIQESATELYLGVFDGHGGSDAAEYASKRLMDIIRAQPAYSTDAPLNRDGTRKSLHNAYVEVHKEMADARSMYATC